MNEQKTIVLRSYQKKAVDFILNSMAKGSKKILLIAPTGAGKSVIAASFINSLGPDIKNILVLCGRNKILNQLEETFKKKSLFFNLSNKKNIIYATPMKFIHMEEKAALNLIIVDEAHHAAAESFQKIFQLYKKTPVVFLTATPRRGDGINIKEFCDSIHVIKEKDLGENVKIKGYRYVLNEPAANDYRAKIRIIQNKEEDAAQRGIRYKRLKLSPSSVAAAFLALHRKSLLLNQEIKKTIIFCETIKKSEETMDFFKKNIIIGAEYFLVNSKEKDSDFYLKKLKETERFIIFNVNSLTEGFDYPPLDSMILARPIVNKTLLTQMLGRVSRADGVKNHYLAMDIGITFLQNKMNDIY